jgi:hypothetical protein
MTNVESESKHRRARRGKRDQLLTLINGWDPAGVLHESGRRDQYEFMVDDLLAFLEREGDKGDIATFLDRQISDRFGSKPEGSAQFATKALSWFRIESDEQS